MNASSMVHAINRRDQFASVLTKTVESSQTTSVHFVLHGQRRTLTRKPPQPRKKGASKRLSARNTLTPQRIHLTTKNLPTRSHTLPRRNIFTKSPRSI